MKIVEPPEGQSIMAVAAHPDDIESWCAGTLARSIDRGTVVRLLLVTSGEHGTNDPSLNAGAVATMREQEAERAAEILGIAEVDLLRLPDGEVEETRDLRAEVVGRIRRWRPDALFTHDPVHPWPPYLSHRDHRAVGRVVLDAVYPLARDRLAFPEQVEAGLQPHAVHQVWLFASEAADSAVDISAGFERKVAARLAHVSQTPVPSALPAAWRERAARFGAPTNLSLAETFKVLHLE